MKRTKTRYRRRQAMRNMNQVRMLVTTLCFLLGGSIFAIAQEASQATSTLHTMRRFPGHMAESEVLEETSPASTKPQWSSGFEWTASVLSSSSAVYNPSTNVMIVFAGEDWGNGVTLSNAVLLQTPANGHGKWSTLIANGTAGSPPPRWGHTAVYDPASNRMIVFGGAALGSQYFSDVWVLNNADGQGGTATWNQLSPSGSSPEPRWGHTAIYDPANNRLIVFGGANASQTFSDVWALNNANGLGGTPIWTQLFPGGSAP